MDVRLPRVQQRIMDLLSDGIRHTREELVKCLWDGEDISPHLTAIRKVIRPHGHDISYMTVMGVGYYQLVRLLGSPYKG